MLIGSEGILGVITEAWVRVHERPEHKASAGVAFSTFAAAAEAVRALGQSGLDPVELPPARRRRGRAHPASATDGSAMLVLGFESADQPVDALMEQALELCRDLGGEVRRQSRAQVRVSAEGAVGAWRHAFLAAPYLRDTLVACGVLSETFETAITWDRFAEFHATVRETAVRPRASRRR